MTAFLPQQTTSLDSCQNVQALKAVFASLDENSCPRTYNFHLHTSASDGQLQPELLAAQTIEVGLLGFAVTDHHSIYGFNRIRKHFQQLQASGTPVGALPQLWTGLEVTAQLLDTEVHILGYGFDPEHPILDPYLTGQRPVPRQGTAAQVISAIHAARGLTVLAHPARYRRSAEDLIAAAVDCGIDGVETFYSYANPSPWQPSPKQTELVQRLAESYQLFNTCGTDTHGLNILQRL